MTAELIEIAQRMLGQPVISLEQIKGGKNSRIHRARTANADYALKAYASVGVGSNARFAREADALELFARSPLADRVPRLIATEPSSSLLVMEWLDGETSDKRSPADFSAFLGFMEGLDEVSRGIGATYSREAVQACPSLSILCSQIAERRAALGAVIDEPALEEFLRRDFDPIERRAVALARRGYADHGIDPDACLDDARLTLSPSDFGFHNSIRRTNGDLVFTDFEYFGWDDPVKLIADILWHPAMSLDERESAAILATGHRLHGTDPTYGDRLRHTVPLYGLRWAVILLNEFLPANWRRRQMADPSIGDADLVSVKTRQLEKARHYLAQVEQAIVSPRGNQTTWAKRVYSHA